MHVPAINAKWRHNPNAHARVFLVAVFHKVIGRRLLKFLVGDFPKVGHVFAVQKIPLSFVLGYEVRHKIGLVAKERNKTSRHAGHGNPWRAGAKPAKRRPLIRISSVFPSESM